MITDKLNLKTEPSDSRYSYPHIGGADDEAGSLETEVGEFLYGLVRMMKPEAILETGTYHGVSASYMADALKKNGSGKIITLEYEHQNQQIANELFNKLDVKSYIQTELISSLDYKPKEEFDFMWLDTEPNLRYQELIKYFPFLKPGGFVFIHDLHPHMSQTGIEMNGVHNWPYGDLPEQIKNWIKDGELVKWHFRTPRGLTGFYRPGPDDYKAI